MPCEVTLRNGTKLMLADTHDQLVRKINDSINSSQAIATHRQVVQSSEWDEYSRRDAGNVTLLIDEIGAIVDKPSRPRL